jgi:methionyl-tRNA formyltransferase
MAPWRIIFMGTAELACASLRRLCLDPSFRVIAVVTQPDRPKGRELKLQVTPVKAAALRENLAVLQPERARSEAFVAQLKELRPDLIVVAAYGQILPPAVLEVPRLGCVNVHTSLLPKYRGAAPIQWAILNDESETGVTIMKMDAGLDTGAVLAQAATPIAPEDDAPSLHDRLARLGADLLVKTIPDYASGKIIPRPQPVAGATYARKITREDGRLNWPVPARALWNRVRALKPWPGTFTLLPTTYKSRLLKIWSAEIESQLAGEPGKILSADQTGIVVGCGQQALRLLELQREGGRRLTAQQFLAGHDLKPGEQLGDS